MKKRICLGLMLIGLLLAGCQSQTVETETPMSEDEAFALYLVADEQMAGADIKQYDINELPLASDPIITTEDIASYNWENHYFHLTQEAYATLLTIFSQGMPMSGVPFVILSNGERIYAGSFWSPLSSLSFDGVVILQPLDPTNAPFSIVLGYPTSEFYTGEDPRSNAQLRKALEDAGLLE